MTENKPISKSRDTVYRVVIILIVAVAAYSNATKELNRLQEMMGGAHEFTEAGLGGLAKVYAATRSLSESSRVTSTPEISSADGFDWNSPVATGGSIEIQGVHHDINAEPADSHEMEVLANNSSNDLAKNLARRSDKDAEDMRGVDFLKGLTAKAIYPATKVTSDPQKSSCDLKEIQLNVSGSQVSRRVLDTIPVGLGLLERAVNGEIDASTLPETVIANAMNRRIRVSRKDHARPRTKSEVEQKKDSADWPNAIKFMKVAFDRASTTSAEVDIDIFRREMSPDVQLHSPKMNYRYISGESEMSDSN